MEKNCFEKVLELLENAAYELRSKKREQDFTRNRKMPFKKLMRFMPGMVKESSQNALGRFFQKIKVANRMSQQAFSLARQKVKREALPELFRASVEGSCSEPLNAWRGKYLVMAIDPGRIALPRDAELRAYYGATGHEQSAPTARVSMLYDIDNGIIADAIVERLSADGRSLAKQHIEALIGGGLDFGGRTPIIVFDRGYPSRDLIKYLRDKKIKYVMRVPKGFNPDIDSTGEGSQNIRLAEGIRTRAAVFRLKSGEREALKTNLDGTEAEDAAFPGLYHKR